MTFFPTIEQWIEILLYGAVGSFVFLVGSEILDAILTYFLGRGWRKRLFGKDDNSWK